VSGHNKGALLTWYDAELESRLHAAFARRPFVNLEYAVPLDRFDEAVARLAPIYARHASHPMAFISFRPVGADDAGYLVASKGQAVVYVDITWVEELERLYTDVEQALIRSAAAVRGRAGPPSLKRSTDYPSTTASSPKRE
jgi:hypothetical protein